MTEQESSDLAINYLNERKGYPTEYRHRLMDGETQGYAFLNAIHYKERDALHPRDVAALKAITSISGLNTFILQLLDRETKEPANA